MTDTNPDHVRVYSWATGREVSHDAKYGWIIRDGDIGPEVPDPDSDAFFADMVKGLLAKGYRIELVPDRGQVLAYIVQSSILEYEGDGPTPNAALIAATLKIGEQG